MIPWEHLASSAIPGEAGELRLMRRGAEYSIMIGGNELMNSRLSGSEEALATLAITRLGPRPAPRILIGGLGMGFTLRAALETAPQDATIVVAELVPAVVDWARGPMAAVFGDCLTDRRVSIEIGDVAQSIAANKEAWDAILLDVDNGPDGLTRGSNDGLYALAGLAAARAALAPGGILAVWSSAPDEGFTRRLVRAGFSVEDQRVKAHRGKRGARHVVWLATRPVGRAAGHVS